MRGLSFVICLIGSAVSHHWGLPQQVRDTPEVAAAKSAHLAALSKAHERSWNGPEDDGSYRPEHHGESRDNDDGSWDSNGRFDESDNDGPWNEERTTSQAHWAHQQWNYPASQPQQWAHPAPHHWDAQQQKWTGPVALPPGFDKKGAPLPVLDTPEVAEEKAKHFHLYAHGARAAAPAHKY